MAIFLYEFLYRGRPGGSAEPPAWHLILGSATVNDFGKSQIAAGDAMSVTQAKEAGWGLPEIVAAINADVLVETEAQRVLNVAQAAKISEQAEALEQQTAAIETASTANRKLAASIEDRQSALAKAEARIATLTDAVAVAEDRADAAEAELARRDAEAKPAVSEPAE